MNILGIIAVFSVIGIGLQDRGAVEVSIFDWHAAAMIILGTLGAVLTSSGLKGLLRVIQSLKIMTPFGISEKNRSDEILQESRDFENLWLEGKNLEAIQYAEKSNFSSTKLISRLILEKARSQRVEHCFQDLTEEELSELHTSIKDWEMMSRLGPSFGMVGTITGMVTLFKNMEQLESLGSSMSLALVAALYGIAFGAGVAGPLAQALTKSLESRLTALQRCERVVISLVEA